MIEGFRLPVAIDMMVAVEEARRDDEIGNAHNQAHWGQLRLTREQTAVLENGVGDLLYDKTGHHLIGVGTCGTSRCAAGWVLSNEKVPVIWERVGRGVFEADRCANGRSVSDEAALRLGVDPDALEEDEAPEWDENEGFLTLFGAHNTVDDLYRIVADYAGVTEAEVRAQVVARMVHRPTPKVNLDGLVSA